MVKPSTSNKLHTECWEQEESNLPYYKYLWRNWSKKWHGLKSIKTNTTQEAPHLHEGHLEFC